MEGGLHGKKRGKGGPGVSVCARKSVVDQSQGSFQVQWSEPAATNTAHFRLKKKRETSSTFQESAGAKKTEKRKGQGKNRDR